MGLIWLAKKEPFYVFPEPLGWNYNLHVIPEYRRKGIASSLVDEAEKCTKSKGLSSIGLHVVDFNTAARQLYESKGYCLVATHNESNFYKKIIS